MPDLIDALRWHAARWLERQRRRQLLRRTNRAYSALRSNPTAWQNEVAERSAWDATLADRPAEEQP